MANKMMKKFDKYWSNISTMNMFLFIAPVLDPRHKKGYVFFIVRQSFEEDKAQALCQKIDRLLEELFKHYLAVVGVVNESNGAASEVSEADSAMDVDDDPSAYLNSKYKIQLDEASSSIDYADSSFVLNPHRSCDFVQMITEISISERIINE
ncbi:zinc finger BED domain-containing protein RICESLEEPER 2-like protein [Tanacetum coccineum]